MFCICNGDFFFGHRKIFPYGHLLRLKYLFVYLFSPPSRGEESRKFVIDLYSAEDVAKKRKDLARYIWGEGGFPIDRFPDETNCLANDALAKYFRHQATGIRWIVRMDHGIDSDILVLTPKRVTKDIVIIYQQGHEGSAWAGKRVIGHFIAQGYQVVVIEMPLLGRNSSPVINLRRHGAVKMSSHDFFTLRDYEFGGNSIRYFVEPVIAAINQLMTNGVKRFAMLGSSGGGWTTTLCAALDPRIYWSFSVAGSLPFNLRQGNELSDYENHLPALYNIVNYPELYILSASSGERLAMQILNKYDTVVFSGDRGKLYQSVVQEFLSRFGLGRYSCVIDSTWVGHGISRYALKIISAHLNKSLVD